MNAGGLLVSHLTPLDASYRTMLQGATQTLIVQGSGLSRAATQAQGLLYDNVQRQSMMLSFVDNFWLLSVMFLALIPLMFVLKKMRPQKARVAAH